MDHRFAKVGPPWGRGQICLKSRRPLYMSTDPPPRARVRQPSRPAGKGPTALHTRVEYVLGRKKSRRRITHRRETERHTHSPYTGHRHRAGAHPCAHRTGTGHRRTRRGRSPSPRARRPRARPYPRSTVYSTVWDHFVLGSTRALRSQQRARSLWLRDRQAISRLITPRRPATTVTAGAQSVARASDATAQPKFSEHVASFP